MISRTWWSFLGPPGDPEVLMTMNERKRNRPYSEPPRLAITPATDTNAGSGQSQSGQKI